MPLHVQVKSQRHPATPGDSYRATIGLTHNEDHDAIFVIERISVRCHGLEICDPGWVSAKYYAQTPTHKKDGRRMIRTLFATQANQILEKMVFLASRQDKQYAVSCLLPEKLPPSFKGTSVRYIYELQVEVKYRQLECNEQGNIKESFEKQQRRSVTLKSPFYVFPSYLDATQMNNNEGYNDEVPMLEVEFHSEMEPLLQWSEVSEDDRTSSTEGSLSKVLSESAESSSTARLILKHRIPSSVTDARSLSHFSIPESEFSFTPPIRKRSSSLTHAEVQTLVSTRTRPQMYNLRFGNETVVLLSFNPCMARPLRLGSTIGGVLRLSDMDRNNLANWRCLSYTVMLETEEEVDEAWRPETFHEQRVIRRLHCEHSEFTGDALATNFMFSIPTSAPPSFKTPLVSLRWVLKFEFEVGRPVDWDEMGEIHPPSRETEPLIWQLPLTVYPF